MNDKKLHCHFCGSEKRPTKSDRFFDDDGNRRITLECNNPNCDFGVIESDHAHRFNSGSEPAFEWPWTPKTERWEHCKICGKYSGVRPSL